ncbi:PIN domain-containing protein [Dactylosporangium sp. NPDC049525]|uniref:PIN-like domain-containing protein n=1 Tax=Dactylosporangium sp. NPDC049525 TaxID=3154730 RepID=UPI00344370D9
MRMPIAMSPAFSEQFSHFLSPSDEDTAAAIKTGFIVLDTNVLLSAYRFAPNAREELLSAIERIGDRVWVPHQVGLEFHKNRYEVVADYAAAYRAVLDALADHRRKFEPEIDQKIRFMAGRTGLNEDKRNHLLQLVTEGLESITDAVEELQSLHGLDGGLSNDKILERVQSILDGKIGVPLEPGEHAEAILEAKRRIASQEPPGFKDAKKLNPEGDYLVWIQTLKEARRRNSDWLVLVTGDVKEDWFLRQGNRTIAARPELTAEARRFADTRLILMQTQTFLHHAKNHLALSVSADTLRQAGRIASPDTVLLKRLEDQYVVAVNDRERHESDLVNAERLLDVLKSRFAELLEDYRQTRLIIDNTGTAERSAALERRAQQVDRVQSEVSDAQDRYYAARASLADSDRELSRLFGEISRLQDGA